MDDLIGKTFGPYAVTEKIGEGGMAVVYRGFQASLNRYVAIKVLRGDLARNQEFVARFHREALAVAKLSHPNILHVYDAGAAHGVYYIVMDYAEGGTLKDLIHRGPVPIERAVSITVQLADALDYAHKQGLIHRDVKPSNVLLTSEGRPLLTDFGIARLLDQATQLTRTGTSIGTPEYMAPEQAQGQPPDGRVDVYALGIVLFEMLAGTVPFRADTPVATMYKHVHEAPPPLRQLNRAVPAWLEAAVAKALAKNPQDRFQRAGALANALRQGGALSQGQTGQQRRAPQASQQRWGTPPPRRRPTPPPPMRQGTPAEGRPSVRRQRKTSTYLLVGAILLLCAVVSIGGGVLLLSGGGNRPTGKQVVTAVITSKVVTMVVTGELDDGTATPGPTRTPIPSIAPPSSPTPSGVFIPSLEAYVTELRLFESGDKLLPYEEREYSHRFPMATTRYVYWELHISYPESKEPMTFETEAVYYKPDGTEMGRFTEESHIEAGWSSSWHTSGWGWDEPGEWSVGTYRVELYIEGDMVASDTFEIYP